VPRPTNGSGQPPVAISPASRLLRLHGAGIETRAAHVVCCGRVMPDKQFRVVLDTHARPSRSAARSLTRSSLLAHNEEGHGVRILEYLFEVWTGPS
jgi:hypothetical protein